VSIAAVVVLSVSLVTLVQEEGGEQLAQPPGRSDAPPPRAESAPAPRPADQPEMAKAPAPAMQEAPAPSARDRAPLGATAPSSGDEFTPRREIETPPAQRSAAPEAPAPPRTAAAPAPQPFPSSRAPEQERPAAPVAGSGLGAQSAGVRGPAAEDSASAPGESALSARSTARARDDAAASEAASSASAARQPDPVVLAERERARTQARLQKAERPLPDTASVAALLKEFELQPPGKWLERIEVLKREGRQAEADAMLAEFKRRFPAHPLPAGVR
jgi:ribonuclease E